MVIGFIMVVRTPLFELIRKKRPVKGSQDVWLHMDNARPHTSRQTSDFIAQTKVKTLSHPPYSPDLAPCDFFLFPKLKDLLKGKTYSSDEELTEALESALATFNRSFISDMFEEWVKRCNRCVEVGGQYFERLK